MIQVIEVSGNPMTVVTQEENIQVIALAEQGPTGPQGIQGVTGAAGQGVPTGGATGQLLTKTGGADYAAAWQDINGQAALNSISGTNNRFLARQSGVWTPLVYQDSGVQTLGTTITWTGTTAPSGSTNHYYWWTQLDKMVQLWVVLNYATASTATTQVQVAWPSDVPLPFEWVGLTAASSLQYSGFASAASTPVGSGATGRGYIRRNAAGTANEITALFSSISIRTVHMNFIYRAV